jgi:predicted homoserine dehydrogenase-like protein
LDPEGKRKTLVRRAEIFKGLIGNHGFDICETQIMANALNLEMDAEKLHYPVVRGPEIPCVLCPEENGGILRGSSRIEIIMLLRDIDASNMGGGVWTVVSSKNQYSRDILNGKGLHHSPDGMASLLPRPYHLCGVETPTTLLCAGALGISSLVGPYLPKYDMYTKTLRPMKAGEIINCDDHKNMESLLCPARAAGSGVPLHSYFCHNLKLKRDIPENTVLTLDMVEIPADSLLMDLRRKQDDFFGLE